MESLAALVLAAVTRSRWPQLAPASRNGGRGKRCSQTTHTQVSSVRSPPQLRSDRWSKPTLSRRSQGTARRARFEPAFDAVGGGRRHSAAALGATWRPYLERHRRPLGRFDRPALADADVAGFAPAASGACRGSNHHGQGTFPRPPSLCLPAACPWCRSTG